MAVPTRGRASRGRTGSALRAWSEIHSGMISERAVDHSSKDEQSSLPRLPEILDRQVPGLAAARQRVAVVDEELARFVDHFRVAADHDAGPARIDPDSDRLLELAVLEQLRDAGLQRAGDRLARDDLDVFQLVREFAEVLVILERLDQLFVG